MHPFGSVRRANDAFRRIPTRGFACPAPSSVRRAASSPATRVQNSRTRKGGRSTAHKQAMKRYASLGPSIPFRTELLAKGVRHQQGHAFEFVIIPRLSPRQAHDACSQMLYPVAADGVFRHLPLASVMLVAFILDGDIRLRPIQIRKIRRLRQCSPVLSRDLEPTVQLGPRKPETSHARIEDHRLGRVGFHRGQGIVAHIAHGAFQGGRTAQPSSPIRERSEGRDARGRRHRHHFAGSPLGQPVVAAQFVQELDEQGKAGRASRLDASELGRGHHDVARRAHERPFRQCARTHVEGRPRTPPPRQRTRHEKVDGRRKPTQPRIRERGEIGDAKPGVPNVRRAEGQNRPRAARTGGRTGSPVFQSRRSGKVKGHGAILPRDVFARGILPVHTSFFYHITRWIRAGTASKTRWIDVGAARGNRQIRAGSAPDAPCVALAAAPRTSVPELCTLAASVESP